MPTLVPDQHVALTRERTQRTNLIAGRRKAPDSKPKLINWRSH